MAPIPIRRAISLVKDKTSISIANGALEALIVKATSHDAGAAPAEKHLDEIVTRTYISKPRAYSCVTSLSKRLERTRDWVVALKALILIHRLLVHGGKVIRDEIEHASFGRFGGLLDLSGFRDESHSDSWDYSEFVRSYAVYLSEKVRFLAEQDDELRGFGKVKKLQCLLDRILQCRPSGTARSNKIVISAVYMIAADSFDVYGDLCEGLSGIVDGFPELGFESSALALELYVKAKSQIDGLFEYYNMCRDIGVSYPEVDRISDELLKSLEEFLKAKLSVSNQEEKEVIKESIWMLPPPEMEEEIELVKGDLIDFEENENGDELALTVVLSNSSSSDEAHESKSNRECEDWELALVESASELARQREREEDPFAASLGVPPPLYVQMADMERNQQRTWRQF